MKRIEEILDYVYHHESSAFFYTPGIFKNARSALFLDPVESVTAKDQPGIFEALSSVDDLLDRGLQGYGLISYEAGFALEDTPSGPLRHDPDFPRFVFHFFENDKVILRPSRSIDFSRARKILSSPDYHLGDFFLSTPKEKYKRNIERIKKHIAHGNTYQVNYTIRGRFGFRGHPGHFFLQMLFHQSAAYSAFVNLSEDFVLSSSPELFFRLAGNVITVKPMKGTIGRGVDSVLDRRQKNKLRKSEKDRAENLMIVDLLRNDLGKFCRPDSIKVTSLFDIEKFESLFQMTSTIRSTGADGKLSTAVKNLFPCGSITGAPKKRTMEIIRELEDEPRGIYTGALGIIEKRQSVFNVAIRTLKIHKPTGKGEIGLGGGIVWDSDPEREYDEVLLKGRFLTGQGEYFEIFETMLIENKAVFLGGQHKKRIARAAGHFLFCFDGKAYDEVLERVMKRCRPDRRYRLKINLDKWGRFQTKLDILRESPPKIPVNISPSAIEADNPFLYFKTTQRRLYDEERRMFSKNGYFETLYVNRDGELTEGSFTNIVLVRGSRRWTPPRECGLLGGCYREFLLKNGFCREKRLTLEDLQTADKLILVNSVRKEMPVDEVFQDSRLLKNYSPSLQERNE